MEKWVNEGPSQSITLFISMLWKFSVLELTRKVGYENEEKERMEMGMGMKMK